MLKWFINFSNNKICEVHHVETMGKCTSVIDKFIGENYRCLSCFISKRVYYVYYLLIHVVFIVFKCEKKVYKIFNILKKCC